MENVLNIVIADDYIELANTMKEHIERDARYEVIGIAGNDKDEIELIEKLKPDVVITDLMRDNKMTGLDIIKEYKDREDNPIFFVISAITCFKIEELRNNGVEYHLDKPFVYEHLMTNLANIYYRKFFRSYNTLI